MSRYYHEEGLHKEEQVFPVIIDVTVRTPGRPIPVEMLKFQNVLLCGPWTPGRPRPTSGRPDGPTY